MRGLSARCALLSRTLDAGAEGFSSWIHVVDVGLPDDDAGIYSITMATSRLAEDAVVEVNEASTCVVRFAAVLAQAASSADPCHRPQLTWA